MTGMKTILKSFLALGAFASLSSLGFLARAETSEVADAVAGEALFQTYCQACHGPRGNGDGPDAAEMYLKPRDFAVGVFKFDTDADWQRGTDTDLANVITNGAGAYGGSDLMPAWDLEDEEVRALVAFIRSLVSN